MNSNNETVDVYGTVYYRAMNRFNEQTKYGVDPRTPTYTGVLRVNSAYVYGDYNMVYSQILHYVNGNLHNENGPAVISWAVRVEDELFIREEVTNNSTTPPPDVYPRYNYRLNGISMTAKAWKAAKENGFQQFEDCCVANYTFNGIFQSDDFEFVGYRNRLICVRLGQEWFVLNKQSRLNGGITTKINQFIKGSKEKVTELSQRELERFLVTNIGTVLG